MTITVHGDATIGVNISTLDESEFFVNLTPQALAQLEAWFSVGEARTITLVAPLQSTGEVVRLSLRREYVVSILADTPD